MSDMVKRLRERRQQIWDQMKAVADKAVEENRALRGHTGITRL